LVSRGWGVSCVNALSKWACPDHPARWQEAFHGILPGVPVDRIIESAMGSRFSR
jgi:hypothetical protein